jgi:hypothetical protein
MADKPVVVRATMSRSRTFVAVAGGIGAAYVGSELLLIVGDPGDTRRDAPPAFSVAVTTSAPTTFYSIEIGDALLDAMRRVDMPKLHGVVVKPTKPSA